MKVFFCHASEDKPAVEQIFKRVASAFPDVVGWLDKYEIVGGDDLLEKIGGAIGKADKFLVFLSAASIHKPWVNAELHEALMLEIEGDKPLFVIPVKLDEIDTIPAFIKAKRYIDLEQLAEDEWLKEIRAAIDGIPPKLEHDQEQNLVIEAGTVEGEPGVVAVMFGAKHWPEKISFRIQTLTPIRKCRYRLLPPEPGARAAVLEETETAYGVRLPNDRISPDTKFMMVMQFDDPDAQPATTIAKIDRWDGGTATERIALHNID